MSLLTIVKSVMDSNGWPSGVTSVSASQDQNMRQSFALINKVLKSVSYKKDWPVLTREWRFPTVLNQVDYDLPPDFHHMVVPSAVDAGGYYAMKGGLTPLQWYRHSLNGSVDWADGFRIEAYGKKFQLAPTPSSPQDLVFMYITNEIAVDASGVPITQYSQDTDEALVDEDIIELGLSWRWRQKKGLDYTAEMAEFSGTLRTRFAQYTGTGVLPVGGNNRWGDAPLTQGRIPSVFGV